MNRSTRIGVGIAAGAATVAAGAVIILASPASSVSNTADVQPVPAASSAIPSATAADPGEVSESPLAGDDATKATEAAQKAVEGGTVIRVETDPDGTFEAHVRKADGTEVVVKMDGDFNVTSIEAAPGGGRGGPGMNETPLAGDDATKATEAAQKAVEGGTVIRVETDSDGTYEAHVRKADGTEVVVKMDKDFKVTAVEEFTGGMGRGMGRGGHGGGMHGTPLTGDEATKATEAAQKAVEGGTVVNVTTDPNGAYQAMVRKADGAMVVVKLDKDFKVTSTEEFTGRMGRGGPGMNETPLTGDDATKATEAAQKAVEGGTVMRVETDSDGTYEAHVRKADGTEVVVKMDKDFKVTAVEEFTGGMGRGMGRGGHGGGSWATPSASASA